MMLRVFLLASLLVVGVAFADHHEDDHEDDHDDHEFEHYGCCSHEDRHEIQYLWASVWESSFTERKISIAQAVYDEVFERYPESKALFSRVHVDDRDSPQWRAQLMRITNGWDMLVNMLEDPEVLYKEIEHLTDQHVAREGMKGKYMLAMLDAFDHVLPQLAPCFNLDAWHRCFSKIMHMIADKLP